MSWIALAIATVGTSLQLTVGAAESVIGERVCSVAPQRLSVEHVAPRSPSTPTKRLEGGAFPDARVILQGRRLHEALLLASLVADLERNETLKRLVLGAMQADAHRRR